jgi:hypothetical protein
MLVPTNPASKSSRLKARREICEVEHADRMRDGGKREEYRAVVQRKAAATGAPDDPAPKRSNQRPQGERRKGAKDDSAEWIHRALCCLNAASLAQTSEDFGKEVNRLRWPLLMMAIAL